MPPKLCNLYLTNYKTSSQPTILNATYPLLKYSFKSNDIIQWISIDGKKYGEYYFEILKKRAKYEFKDTTIKTIKLHFKTNPKTKNINIDNTNSIISGKEKSGDLLLVNYDNTTRGLDYTTYLLLTLDDTSSTRSSTVLNLTDTKLSPPISLSSSFVIHNKNMGDYSNNKVPAHSDFDTDVSKDLAALNSQCKSEDFKLPKSITGDSDMLEVIKKLLKHKKGICCDDIDLSKHVLKSSIVPCSNLIPEKYKKYAEKYQAGDNIVEEDDEPVDIHTANVMDKFSIVYIVLIIFIIFIILLNIM